MLNKNQRLRKNGDFLFLKSQGSQFITPYFKFIYRYRPEAENFRIGIIVGNYIGGAVKRNRIKRMIRSVFKEVSPAFKQKVDLICLVRPQILRLNYLQLQNEISRALQNAGLINTKN